MTSTYALYHRLASRPQGRRLFSAAFALKAPYFRTVLPDVRQMQPHHAEVRLRSWWGVHNHLGTVHVIAICNGLEAAMGLLESEGLEAVSLRAVARAAGVSHAAPYHHFANRDELLAAVAARAFEQLGATMQASASAQAEPREQLLAIAEAYVHFARDSPARFRLMFGPLLATRAQHPALDHAAAASFAVLLGAAERLDARLALPLALTGWSLAHGLSHLLLDEAFAGLKVALPEPELLVRQLSALVLAGR